VEVKRRVVTLRGELPSYEEIRYATDDAWDVDGVVGSVRSELRCAIATAEAGGPTALSACGLTGGGRPFPRRGGQRALTREDGGAGQLEERVRGRCLRRLSGIDLGLSRRPRRRGGGALRWALRLGGAPAPAPASHAATHAPPGRGAPGPRDARGARRDARWVRGLCAAWNVPFATERRRRPAERSGPRARYAFLRRVQEEHGRGHMAHRPPRRRPGGDGAVPRAPGDRVCTGSPASRSAPRRAGAAAAPVLARGDRPRTPAPAAPLAYRSHQSRARPPRATGSAWSCSRRSSGRLAPRRAATWCAWRKLAGGGSRAGRLVDAPRRRWRPRRRSAGSCLRGPCSGMIPPRCLSRLLRRLLRRFGTVP
jgi:hypothetical protein